MVLTPLALSVDQRHWSSILCLSTFMFKHLVVKKRRPEHWTPYSSHVLHPESIRVVVAWMISSFQKKIVLIIWSLFHWSIWSLKRPAIFETFSPQPSEEPLSPSKELNTQICNACYRNHKAIQDSMTNFEPPHNWPRDSRVILGAFAMGNIISQSSEVCPNNFKALHPSKARD